MFKRLQLVNFKRHRSLDVTFGPGINAIKAPNEGGKTSLLQGLTYALFGSSALPQTLEETVTWGESPSSMRATLSFVVGSKNYTIVRSKNGAELRNDDIVITGQKSTSEYLKNLLGLDVSNVGKLMVAGQGDIRGVLGEGPKGASALIEALTQFGDLETVTTRLAAALRTGSTKQDEELIERNRGPLAEIEAALPGLQAECQATLYRKTEAAQRVEQVQAKYDLAHIDASKAADWHTRATSLEQAHQAAQTVLAGTERRLASLKANPPEAPGTTGEMQQELLVLAGKQEALRKRVNLRRMYDQVEAKNGEWAAHEPAAGCTSLADAQDDLDAALTNHQASTQAHSAALQALAVAKARKGGTQGICDVCHLDRDQMPSVVEAREAQQRAEAAAKIVADEATKVMLEDQESLKVAQAEHALWREAAAAAERGKGLVELRATPKGHPRLAWLGATEGVGVEELLAELQAVAAQEGQVKARIEGIAKAQRAMDRWKADVKTAEAALRVDQAAVTDHPAPEASSKETGLQLAAAREKEKWLKDHLLEVRGHLSRAEAEQIEAERAYSAAQGGLALRRGQTDEALARIKDVKFNNELMKAVRAARPAIVSRLWGLMLASVSTCFSTMRGEPSEVTRDESQFLVNGHSALSLSGSTQDILGLAIRVALQQVFLPTLPVLVLDEPNAAMDDERAASVLAFVSSSGLDQVLIVSHETLTDSVADTLIELS